MLGARHSVALMLFRTAGLRPAHVRCFREPLETCAFGACLGRLVPKDFAQARTSACVTCRPVCS